MAGSGYLFCPGDRPERVQKAAALADVLIIDLEDGVASDRKSIARRGLADVALALDLSRTIVRIGAAGTEQHALDVVAARAAGIQTVMLAKAEDPEAVDALDGLRCIALCETPRGVMMAGRLAAAEGCVGLMWGSEDLAADLAAWGARDSAGVLRPPLAAARDAVLLAARAAGVLAIDTVFPDVADLAGLRRETELAASTGWDAKASIHPSQLAIVREAFRPPADRIAWAQQVLDSMAAERGGVALVDGAMVDEPVLRAARAVLERA